MYIYWRESVLDLSELEDEGVAERRQWNQKAF